MFCSFAGSIFHVRVHTPQKGLEHALLYSIGVNLPAHRVGQLDRVLVLASPVNDINIHAWDLNRVKHFMRLDIGIQMELCGNCVTSSLQGTSITFILDKVFQDECLNFLCQEARISNQPVCDNSLLVYPVNHTCTRSGDAGPPTYFESQHYVFEGKAAAHTTATDLHSTNFYATQHNVNPHVDIFNRGTGATHPSSSNGTLHPFQPAVPANLPGNESVPPRNITRKNFESAVPAIAHPYMNFQPQVFQQSCSSSFDSPYQISSRIIITNSGEVQYERNILGNKPQHHGGFHFKSSMPLPPRSTNSTPKPSSTITPQPSPATPNISSATPNASSDMPKVITPSFQISRSPTRTVSLPTSHGRQEKGNGKPKPQKRASELSDSEDSYVFIPDVVRDPTRIPLSQEHGQPRLPESSVKGPNPASEASNVNSPFYVNYSCSSTASNNQRSPVGGCDFQEHSPDDKTAHHPSQYPYQEESISHNSPSDCRNPSFQTSSQPQHQAEGTVASQTTPPERTAEETNGLTGSFSGDYDDVVLLTQSLLIRQGNGNVPNVVAMQEIRSSDSPVPLPPSGDYRVPPPDPPNKPQVKPRRHKIFSESDMQTDSSAGSPVPTTAQKSMTIPKQSVSSTGLSQSPCHHMLDTTSQDDPTSPIVDADGSHSFYASPQPHAPPTYPMRPQQQSVLNYPPLTPPIPRPRLTFSRHTGGGVQQSEDDSVVGRNRVGSSHNQHSRLSSTQFPTSFIPFSDV